MDPHEIYEMNRPLITFINILGTQLLLFNFLLASSRTRSLFALRIHTALEFVDFFTGLFFLVVTSILFVYLPSDGHTDIWRFGYMNVYSMMIIAVICFLCSVGPIYRYWRPLDTSKLKVQ